MPNEQRGPHVFPFASWPDLLEYLAKTLDNDADSVGDLPYTGMHRSSLASRTRAAAYQVRYLAGLLSRATTDVAEAVDRSTTDASLYIDGYLGGASPEDRHQLQHTEEAVDILRLLAEGPRVAPYIETDPTLPLGTVQFRDPTTGRVLGTIVGLDVPDDTNG